MKKPLIVVALILGLAGLMAISAKEVRSEDASSPLEVSFSYLPSYSDSATNLYNSHQDIDSTFVRFTGLAPDGTMQDTTGILEESFSSQNFSFGISGGRHKKVDSLGVVWKATCDSTNLFVINGFAGTPGFNSTLREGGVVDFNPKLLLPGTLNTQFSLKIEVGEGGNDPNEVLSVSGNLAVVIITIDPAETANLTPVYAGYKVAGGNEWISISLEPFLAVAKLPE